MCKKEIMDTTLRDGEQMDNVAYNSKEKVMIAKKLFDAGIHRIEVASAFAVEEDKKAITEICKMASVLGRLKNVEVLGFVDEKRSIDWIYDCGCRTVNILTKGSKEQREGQLKKTLKEHLKDIKYAVSYANSKGMDVNTYLEDWSTGMLNSKEEVIEMISTIKEMQVKRIMLADTLGILPHWKTRDFIKELISKFPEVHFDYHAHNDYELAVANTLEALKAGVKGIHVTVNGLGERAGNCSLYSIVVSAKDHLGIDFGIDEKLFIDISKLVETSSKVRLSPHFPIVGENVRKQTSGIHADGDKKGGLYQNKLTAERFGRKECRQYPLGKHSGSSSIELNLKSMGLNADKNLIKRLTVRVRNLGAKKNIVTQEDLYFLFLDEVEKIKKRPFEVLDCKGNVNLNGTRSGCIRVKLNGKIYEEKGAGSGCYDAIMNALEKILVKQTIILPKLIDYNPRIPPGGGTGALVEAVITWKNRNKMFKTTGIDTDQTIAAVKATEKALNIILLR